MLAKRIQRLGGFGIALCKCGHLSSDHSSRLSKIDQDHTLQEHHHGGCVECACKQFTFHRFISLEEAAALLQSRKVAV